MTLHDGRYECVGCGATVNLDHAAVPTVTMLARGGQRNIVIVTSDGKELHRCPPTPQTELVLTSNVTADNESLRLSESS